MNKYLKYFISLSTAFILTWTSTLLVHAQQLNTSACPSGYQYNPDAQKCLTINLREEVDKISKKICLLNITSLVSYDACVNRTTNQLYSGASMGGQVSASTIDNICKFLQQTSIESLNTCRSVINGAWNTFSYDFVKAPQCANGLTASVNGLCVKGNFTNTMSPEEGCTDAINTALGCIPYDTQGFTSTLLTFLASTAGAISLVIMLIATIQIMTGGDNAEQVKKGKELFTGAITGLLFIIFSVTLLKIIAGDIIKLPGFQGP